MGQAKTLHIPPGKNQTFIAFSNGHISATGHPIHFVFGSRIGFLGSPDRMALLPVGTNPRWRPAAMLKNFEWPDLSNGSLDPLHEK